MNQEEITAVFQIGIPIIIGSVALGTGLYYLSIVFPIMTSYLFCIPASLIVGGVILTESLEKSRMYVLIPLMIYSLIFGALMIVPFLIIWTIMMGIAYLFKRESRINFNIR